MLRNQTATTTLPVPGQQTRVIADGPNYGTVGGGTVVSTIPPDVSYGYSQRQSFWGSPPAMGPSTVYVNRPPYNEYDQVPTCSCTIL